MNKINRLILTWPKGTVKTTRELNRAGYTSQILKAYANSGWITLVGRGAYRLANDTPDWHGALYCLQQQKDNKIHVGGKSALTLKGFTHYGTLQEQNIELFDYSGEKLPAWFTAQKWMKKLKLYRTIAFPYDNPNFFSSVKIENISVIISSPELAMLEMLYLVPGVHTFDESLLIMESLSTLRSKVVQNLLESTTSVKAKKLFLYMAEKHGHSWFKELNINKIYLGSGKRVIVKNGRLDKKYGITVPLENE